MGFLGLPLIAATGALTAVIAVSVPASFSGEEPKEAGSTGAESTELAQTATVSQSEETPTWQTNLAAAMAEARRTKRPLLAVFR